MNTGPQTSNHAAANAGLRYLANAIRVLERIRASQDGGIETAAQWVAGTISGGGLIYVAGSGHSHMLAEEAFYRAGGLAAIHPLLDTGLMLHAGALKSTAMERLTGLARVIIEDTEMSGNDLLIIASNSGRNAYPVELAHVARERGCRTIALTSLATGDRVTSRHPSGELLADAADLVLDNCVEYGDAAVDIDGHAARVGPLSTVAGAAIINAVMSRATELMVENGHRPETFTSANVLDEDRQARPDMARWRKRVGLL